MSNIAAAQQARAAQALTTKTMYKGQIMTKKEFLQTLKNEGYTPTIGEKHKVQYNRTKYNRMSDHKEQEEYERKCNEKVVEYRAQGAGTSYFEITKTEYEYFTTLFPDGVLNSGEQWASEEELKHLFGLSSTK